MKKTITATATVMLLLAGLATLTTGAATAQQQDERPHQNCLETLDPPRVRDGVEVRHRFTCGTAKWIEWWPADEPLPPVTHLFQGHFFRSIEVGDTITATVGEPSKVTTVHSNCGGTDEPACDTDTNDDGQFDAKAETTAYPDAEGTTTFTITDWDIKVMYCGSGDRTACAWLDADTNQDCMLDNYPTEWGDASVLDADCVPDPLTPRPAGTNGYIGGSGCDQAGRTGQFFFSDPYTVWVEVPGTGGLGRTQTYTEVWVLCLGANGKLSPNARYQGSPYTAKPGSAAVKCRQNGACVYEIVA